MRAVFIVGGNTSYNKMFEQAGWKCVDDMFEADMVQFCGGSDVDPRLYGHNKHPKTNYDMIQDGIDMEAYELAKAAGKPMAGICRGGQFLHVMAGGTMYQDVDNHAISGTHPIHVIMSNLLVEVTSTHHQMMKFDGQGILCGWAEHVSSRRDSFPSSMYSPMAAVYKGMDPEIIAYPEKGLLCFQPHPEFDSCPTEATKLYFNLIENYLFDNTVPLNFSKIGE